MSVEKKYFITENELKTIASEAHLDMSDTNINKVYQGLKSFKTTTVEQDIQPSQTHKIKLSSWLDKNNPNSNNTTLATKIFAKSNEYRPINNQNITSYKENIKAEEDYTLVKAAKENITNATIDLLKKDDLTLSEINNHMAQLNKVELAFYSKRESSLSNIAYYGFPLAHLCPTLGLISAAAAGASVFISPLVILMYSSVYTYNNIKKDGINTTENKMLVAATTIAAAITIAAIVGFAGVSLPFGGALIFPIATTLSFGLFCYGSVLEDRRNNDAISILKVKIKGLMVELSKCQANKNPLEQDKIKLIKKNIDIMLFEYTNIVRTIKFPVTKNDHINLLNEVRLELTTLSIQNTIIDKKITDNESYNKNISEKIKELLPTSENMAAINKLEDELNIGKSSSNNHMKMTNHSTGDHIEMSNMTNNSDIKQITLNVLKRSRFDLFTSQNNLDHNKVSQLTLLANLLNDLKYDSTKEQAKKVLEIIMPIIGDSKGVDTVVTEKLNIYDPSSISNRIHKIRTNSGISANRAFLMKIMEDKAEIVDMESLGTGNSLGLKEYTKNIMNISSQESKILSQNINEASSSIKSLNAAKNHVMSYFTRDTTYYSFNMALLITTTLFSVAPIIGLPLMLTPPVMIGIAATVGLFMLVTSTQWYNSKDKVTAAKEILAPNKDLVQPLKIEKLKIKSVEMRSFSQEKNNQKETEMEKNQSNTTGFNPTLRN